MRVDDAWMPPSPDLMLADVLATLGLLGDPPCRDADTDARWRRLLTRRLVSQLFFLMHHPRVDSALAAVFRTAHADWSARAATHAVGGGDPLSTGIRSVH